MHDQPTPEQFREAFGAQIYRPAGAQAKVTRNSGWGGSGNGISHLSLQFLIGSREESVIIEVSNEERNRTDPVNALMHLVFEFALVRRPRFPMLIERGKQPLPVDGRSRTFTTYTARPATVAVASIGGRGVMIRCATNRLPRLALEPITTEELKRALRPRR